MKKELVYLIVVFLTLSCSSGDDNNNVQSDLLFGTWEYYEINTFAPGTDLSGTLQLITYPHRCATQKDYMIFGEDSSAKNVFNNSDCFQEVSLGTYTKNGLIV